MTCTLTVTPTGFLTQGGTATVCVSGGPSGQLITVDVDDGTLPTPATSSVQIQLNDDGDGCATWNVPSDWTAASFNYGTCDEVTRPIQPPGD